MSPRLQAQEVTTLSALTYAPFSLLALLWMTHSSEYKSSSRLTIGVPVKAHRR